MTILHANSPTDTSPSAAPKQLTFHPLADLFPLMEGQEFDALVADIENNGLHEPIHVLDNQILDGRNRYRACEQLGIKPAIKRFVGTDPAAFVVSLNLHRRHLDESQRAIVAARLATLEKGANQHSEGLPIGRSSELLNISERTAHRAREVLDRGSPELVQAVEQGRVSVSAAAEVSSLPKGEQKTIVAQGKPAVQAAAKKVKAKKKKKTKKVTIAPKKFDAIEPRHREYMALPKDKLILELVALMRDAGITVEQIRVAFESVST